MKTTLTILAAGILAALVTACESLNASTPEWYTEFRRSNEQTQTAQWTRSAEWRATRDVQWTQTATAITPEDLTAESHYETATAVVDLEQHRLATATVLVPAMRATSTAVARSITRPKTDYVDYETREAMSQTATEEAKREWDIARTRTAEGHQRHLEHLASQWGGITKCYNFIVESGNTHQQAVSSCSELHASQLSDMSIKAWQTATAPTPTRYPRARDIVYPTPTPAIDATATYTAVVATTTSQLLDAMIERELIIGVCQAELVARGYGELQSRDLCTKAIEAGQ